MTDRGIARPATVQHLDRAAATTRVRHPDRRRQIVAAAADLFSRNGYAAVGMNDIGAAIGVTGPAIYRHFDSKAALLAAVIDDVIDSVILLDTPPAGTAQEQLIGALRRYAAAVARQRSVMAVFVREIHHLPAAQQSSLRTRQRELVGHWRELLGHARPDWDREHVRTAVHAAFGLLNSVGLFFSPLTDAELADHLEGLCRAAFGLDPAPTG